MKFPKPVKPAMRGTEVSKGEIVSIVMYRFTVLNQKIRDKHSCWHSVTDARLPQSRKTAPHTLTPESLNHPSLHMLISKDALNLGTPGPAEVRMEARNRSPHPVSDPLPHQGQGMENGGYCSQKSEWSQRKPATESTLERVPLKSKADMIANECSFCPPQLSIILLVAPY